MCEILAPKQSLVLGPMRHLLRTENSDGETGRTNRDELHPVPPNGGVNHPKVCSSATWQRSAVQWSAGFAGITNAVTFDARFPDLNLRHPALRDAAAADIMKVWHGSACSRREADVPRVFGLRA